MLRISTTNNGITAQSGENFDGRYKRLSNTPIPNSEPHRSMGSQELADTPSMIHRWRDATKTFNATQMPPIRNASVVRRNPMSTKNGNRILAAHSVEIDQSAGFIAAAEAGNKFHRCARANSPTMNPRQGNGSWKINNPARFAIKTNQCNGNNRTTRLNTKFR